MSGGKSYLNGGKEGAAVQHYARFNDFTLITPTASMSAAVHGGRAKCLQRLVRLGLPVPRTVALSYDVVHRIAEGHMPDLPRLLSAFGREPLLSVRPSSMDAEWGGPGAVLNVGMCDARRDALAGTIGEEAATALYLRFVQAYAVDVLRLDPDAFAVPDASASSLAAALQTFEEETDEPFPQEAGVQLAEVLRSMARSWESTSVRLLRQARGAPADAGLGLVVQTMALGLGPGESGSGVVRGMDPATGEHTMNGRYLRQSIFRDALTGTGGPEGALYLAADQRGASLESEAPGIFAELTEFSRICRKRLREEMEIEFSVAGGTLHVLDAVRMQRSSRAAVKAVVDLAEDGIIPREEAILRIEPRALSQLLHRQVDPDARREVILKGIAASPGAATGRLVFSAMAAQTAASQGDACILLRRETTPEDIRGMHVASAIVTERGGMSSHAAVIARGLGLPCIVGAVGSRIDTRERTVTLKDGRVFREGDMVTVDGSAGVALEGAAPLLEPMLDGPFTTLLGWADKVRDIGIRANADTPDDARTAETFLAEGIGLCRTEHMFFEDARLTLMREMIFTDDSKDRAASLERLLPMQRRDFADLFHIMAGRPVCIRLFDLPLHEFLPRDREDQRALADALDLPLSDVVRRVQNMSEFNPMLGMRGVRLGITVPEIYEMQARAIFEATVQASRETGSPVVPEIMIPLVSARREVELVKTRVDAVAAAVKNESGETFEYRLGVMVETPRAALRAGEISDHAAFLSFGTNDLTQMTYGLSRDDAGRFMGAYVAEGVFPEDPFHTLDLDGVGELLLLGAERARENRPDITVSLCGEHGGDPDTIAFCRAAGFDYVSCSPFRVPVARLAAAHLALGGTPHGTPWEREDAANAAGAGAAIRRL
ncbi:putative PEP-binding protein [Roseicyclus sp. F158]|uniref:Pyruvate, phosphate dikinase n=1 Tax=Tropicimonas omnivorans TaxID=3075590 RepID=A0ABU3DHH2_9RHOB|nr:putative PEP-binding protein [Roseicyclus sp. F158]MDT0682617.1 putative PEP-binding protein [Roseicyclus sp. F158]